MKKHSIILLGAFFCGMTLISNAQAPAWLWARSAGGNTTDRSYSIATDGSGHVYIAGWFSSASITFGSTTLVNTGSDNAFVVKYDPAGQVIWARSAGGTCNAYGIATDSNGNVYVTGAFGSTLIFGSDTLAGSGDFDFFIAKFDSSGNEQWVKKAGANRWDSGWAVATDDSGNVFVTGQFQSDSLVFGNDTLINASLFYDIFVVKYDSSGSVLWAKRAGGLSSEQGYGMATDMDGNIYLTGVSASDVYIAKYDPSGNVLWTRSTGGTVTDVGYGIATDGMGNLYVTGRFDSPSITFGNDTLTNAGGDDIFIAKYDTAGNIVWARSAGGNGTEWGIGIVTDLGGNIYLTGRFNSSSIAFGSTTLTSAGSHDIFLTKYDSSGTAQWAKSMGGNGYDQGNGIAIDGNDHVYLTGWFSSTTIFDNDTLTSAGSEDVFIARLAPIITGIAEEKNAKNSVRIFPNPNYGKFILSFHQPIQNASVKIYNTLGLEIFSESMDFTNRKEIDLSALPGIYVVQVLEGQNVFVRKLIID